MKYFAFMLLLGFTGIAIFGALTMHSGMQEHGGDCAASAAQGIDCPTQSNLFAYLAFHLGAAKKIITATFGATEATLSLLLVLVAGIIGIRTIQRRPLVPELHHAHSDYRRFEYFSLPPRASLLHYLALHENSPALS